MSDRDQHGFDDAGRDRVVDDFFAAHRRQVVDQVPDEETWQVITRRVGRGSRSGGVWFLAGAVAASAATVAVLVGQGLGGPDAAPAGPGDSDPVVVTDPVTPTPSTPVEPPVLAEPSVPTETQDPGEAGRPEPSEPDIPATAPTDGQTSPDSITLPRADLSAGVRLVDEPSGEESELRTTVYSVNCEADQVEWFCPGLAVSEDGGRSWRARVDMYQAGYYAAVSSRERTWMWAADGERPGVPEVQAGLVRSDDAGSSWREIPTRGEGVLAVQAFRSTLVVVTQGCESGTADSCLEVVLTDVSADDATTGGRVVTIEDLPQAVVGVPMVIEPTGVQATYDAVYVHLPHREVSYRIADGEAVATPLVKRGCGVSTAPESPDALLAVCDGGIELSGDGGRTWQQVAGPGGDVIGAASNDGQRLTAATDDALWVRTGDGEEWEQVMPWTPGLTRLAALGGRSMSFGGPYRYYEPGEPRYSQRWVTEDDWQTWTEVPPIEIGSDG